MTDTVVMNWHLSLLHYETNLIPLKFHCHGFLFRIYMCFCCSPRCLISCPSSLPLLLTSHLRSVYIYISKLSFLIELSQPRLCAIWTLYKTFLFCYSVLSLRGYLLKKSQQNSSSSASSKQYSDFVGWSKTGRNLWSKDNGNYSDTRWKQSKNMSWSFTFLVLVRNEFDGGSG